MGDVLSEDPWPGGVDVERVRRALDVAFGSADAKALGLVVTYQ
jgi:hypothetical protein